MTQMPETSHMTAIGFDVISGCYVPWCWCGWMGTPRDYLDTAEKAAAEHREEQHAV